MKRFGFGSVFISVLKQRTQENIMKMLCSHFVDKQKHLNNDIFRVLLIAGDVRFAHPLYSRSIRVGESDLHDENEIARFRCFFYYNVNF